MPTDTADRRTLVPSRGRLVPAAVAGRTFTALGTFCSLLISRPAALPAAGAILTGELAAIDAACSRFRPDSELVAVNRAAGRTLGVSPLLAEALAVALAAAEVTDGDVDPTCGLSLARLGYDRDFAAVAADSAAPGQPPAAAAGWRCVEFDQSQRTVRVPPGVLLDLGATAKALAADRAAAAIESAIGGGVLVNLGGDIAVAGPAPGDGWRVEVRDDLPQPGPDRPTDGRPGRRAGGQVIAIRDGGLATSSVAARRWRRGGRDLHHIVAPGTGLPADGCWATVSVAAASCVYANTASTAAIIRGRAAPGWLAGFDLPARLVRCDGTVLRTGGWPE